MENEKILSNEELLDVTGGSSFIKVVTDLKDKILENTPMPLYAVYPTENTPMPLYAVYPTED